MSTLDNQNAFMDTFKKLAGVSEAYADGIWHTLSGRDKDDPIRSAKTRAYPGTHGIREANFKAELDALCNRHGVELRSRYDEDTDTAIVAQFKENKNDLHDEIYTFTIEE